MFRVVYRNPDDPIALIRHRHCLRVIDPTVVAEGTIWTRAAVATDFLRLCCPECEHKLRLWTADECKHYQVRERTDRGGTWVIRELPERGQERSRSSRGRAQQAREKPIAGLFRACFALPPPADSDQQAHCGAPDYDQFMDELVGLWWRMPVAKV